MNKGFYTAMMLGLALGVTGAMGCAVDPATDGDHGGGDVGEPTAPDKAAPDKAAPENTASDESALTAIGGGGKSTQVIEIRNVTCNSGWPGTRGCSWTFTSAGPIVAGSITVNINGSNGEIGHSAAQADPNHIVFTASVNEGDAFIPGKNTTSYTVAWLR